MDIYIYIHKYIYHWQFVNNWKKLQGKISGTQIFSGST